MREMDNSGISSSAKKSTAVVSWLVLDDPPVISHRKKSL